MIRYFIHLCKMCIFVLVKSGEMTQAEASREYGVAESSISRAINAVCCDKCDSKLSGERLERYLKLSKKDK